jgi:hypothetical protein
MFMLTPAEGLLLAGGWLALTTAVLVGAFVSRSRRAVPAYVTCPMLHRRVSAEVERDEWTRGLCRVVRCDALGRATGLCNQRCLRTAAVVAPSARR